MFIITIRTNATIRMIQGLLARMNELNQNNLCKAIEDYHLDMFLDLKNEMGRLDKNDPQAISTFVDKFTDFKELNFMLKACNRASRPTGAVEPMYRRSGSRYVRVTQ